MERCNAEVEESAGAVGGLLGGGIEFEKDKGVVGELEVEGVGGAGGGGEGEEEKNKAERSHDAMAPEKNLNTKTRRHEGQQ